MRFCTVLLTPSGCRLSHSAMSGGNDMSTLTNLAGGGLAGRPTRRLVSLVSDFIASLVQDTALLAAKAQGLVDHAELVRLLQRGRLDGQHLACFGQATCFTDDGQFVSVHGSFLFGQVTRS